MTNRQALLYWVIAVPVLALVALILMDQMVVGNAAHTAGFYVAYLTLFAVVASVSGFFLCRKIRA
ncbi:hypothetical protein FLK61_27295 [Paenalkalicoccus suaedae]|uniref:Uncharacterized protein n=1 Tax=Paenalkalicoccus suaedae TaxID=2592382 RepID=A0A859FCH4_9BACI|nr:hypothetical protein [Paenalkalicoccus suaedae]QKS70462.1 hypothetical protein FLK61_27295 [Paenalkalicoccus suaedae]